MNYDGQGERALADLTGAPLVVVHESLPSTLDVAHELGAAGAPSGTLVLADEQTAGRGRQGRAWHSPRGTGVWLAVMLRTSAAPAAGAISIRAGLALVEGIAEAAPSLAPRLKWPNDLIVAGRKAGGVLCEARWQGEKPAWISVGAGINVKGPVAGHLRHTAIAVGDLAPETSRISVLASVVPRLLALGGAPQMLDPGERARFVSVAEPLQAGDGAIEGLDPDGALLVRRPGGSLDRRLATA